MALRTLQMLTCFSIAVADTLPASEEAAHGSAKKRQWSDEFKRKIMAPVRRERIRAVKEEEEESCDADVEKQRTPPQRLRPALKRSPRGDGAPEAIAVAVDGIRKRTGLRVRFVLPAADQETSAAPVDPPPFPTGVLGEPPESFRHSGPEMTAAFLASVAADAGSAATPVGSELVARWTERKEACSRRLSYLRDYCPFQREEEEEESAPETATTLPAPEPDHADNCPFQRKEDEESAPETATTLPAPEPDHADNPFQREEDEESAPEMATTLPAAPDDAEALPRVKTGLAFDSPEAEARFVKAIRARYLLSRTT
ncbi:hypothetical protein PVAP13_9KG485200 [Panicum virgatum]|uniref:Uncharacterized protein n=1 Tax=Panicum virgatum TaxID=38727 RepID=A0A8T0NVF1_PANVG|nr:hypothetical protein PVAP13_9KG485200 [Panicum virgatum]